MLSTQVVQLAQLGYGVRMANDPTPLKDQRIPVMMTAQEVAAIDDWMFAKRIRSRGEAIRQLVQLGLTARDNRQDRT